FSEFIHRLEVFSLFSSCQQRSEDTVNPDGVKAIERIPQIFKHETLRGLRRPMRHSASFWVTPTPGASLIPGAHATTSSSRNTLIWR
ncbi:hypothetical protein PENTCL1PPCAC_27827, partial [Pristionchus entomophagus]